MDDIPEEPDELKNEEMLLDDDFGDGLNAALDQKLLEDKLTTAEKQLDANKPA